MQDTKIQNGLIGFFDILGYKNFLENNDVEIAAFEVLKTIDDIGSIVSSGLLASFKEPDDRDKEVVDSIRWLVLSDTILMVMEWDEPKIYEWVVFSLAAIQLCSHMFNFGLPLRGAIRNGKYLVGKSCFAGRVMVDAYLTETSLNLAACSVDEKLVGIIREEEDKRGANLIGRIAVPYMTPLTDGQYKKMFLLNSSIRGEISPIPNAADIRQFVLNSFWAHRKDITESAETKARNTEKFLRFLLHRFPQNFANTSV